MNQEPTRSHKLIYNVADLSWSASGVTAVSLKVSGQTTTPGWSEFTLVPSASHQSSATHLHFDAWGLPPSGIVTQVITDIEFVHRLPAGTYTVTVHSATGEATTHVDYPLGDPR